MDSATEELRRQHIKTLEVLRRFADENARLREAAPCDAVALEKALLRLDARCAAGAKACALRRWARRASHRWRRRPRAGGGRGGGR